MTTKHAERTNDTVAETSDRSVTRDQERRWETGLERDADFGTAGGPAAAQHPLVDLQRRAGNQTTQRLLKHGIQPKLRVGSPNDRYEREADRVARAVTRLSTPTGSEQSVENASVAGRTVPRIQRLCARCRERFQHGLPLNCPDCERTLRRSPSVAGGLPTVSDEVASEIAHSRGNGHPLPPSTRAFFESRFGHEFGDVRVHVGPSAARLNRALDARAFTLGRDVFFGASEYRPESEGGRELLAHELTHVVQQQSMSAPVVQRSPFQVFQQTNRQVANLIIRTHQSIMNGLVPMFESSYPLRDETYVREKTQYIDRTSELMQEVTPQSFNRWLTAAGTLQTSINRIMNEPMRTTSFLQGEALRGVWSGIGDDLRRLRETDINLRGAQIEAQRERRQQRQARAEAGRRREEAQAQHETELTKSQRLDDAQNALGRYLVTFEQDINSAPTLYAPRAAGNIHAFLGDNFRLYIRLFQRIHDDEPELWELWQEGGFGSLVIRQLAQQYGIRGLERYQYHELTAIETLHLAIVGEWYRGQINVEGQREGQELSVIGLGTGIRMVPGLDQVLDVSDLSAVIYYMSMDDEYFDDPMSWLNLGLTLFGVIPELGSFVRGVGKALVTGVRRTLASSVGRSGYRGIARIYNALQRRFPDIVEDAIDLLGRIGRHWDEWVAVALRNWSEALGTARGFFGRLSDSLVEGIDRIRQATPRRLSEGFARLRELFTGFLSFASDTARRGMEAVSARYARIRSRLQGLTATGRLLREVERLDRPVAERILALQNAIDSALRGGDTGRVDELLDELEEAVAQVERRSGTPALEEAGSVGRGTHFVAEEPVSARSSGATRSEPSRDVRPWEPPSTRERIPEEALDEYVESVPAMFRTVSRSGHTVTLTPGGQLVFCSVCTWIREGYARALAREPQLAERLTALEHRAAQLDPRSPGTREVLRETAGLVDWLELTRQRNGLSRGAREALERGWLPPERGYHWRWREATGEPAYIRSPRAEGAPELPRRRYDPESRTFEDAVPGERPPTAASQAWRDEYRAWQESSQVDVSDITGEPNRVVLGDEEVETLIEHYQELRHTDPERYDQYIQDLRDRARPSYRQSESDVGTIAEEVGGLRERSYRHRGRRGGAASTRPDIVVGRHMIEVKNYWLFDAAGNLRRNSLTSLKSRLIEQVFSRVAHGTSPALSAQAIILDLRGQQASWSAITEVSREISAATGVPIENIEILTW
jgi:hypothetical protein